METPTTPVRTYAAAMRAAPTLRAHFERHRTLLQTAVTDVQPATLPDIDAIQAVIDAAFWASLRREEGYVPKISIALLPPVEAAQRMMFDRPLPLATMPLVRVAPAVERPGIHLGVWYVDGELRVWGAARAVPPLTFVLEVSAPGLLVVKHHRGDSGKYVNVAVLEGDQIKVVDERASSLPDCPSLLTSLLALDAPGALVGSVNVLVQLAVSMRAHGRGGSLLVVPANSTRWTESMVHPVSYAMAPRFAELADLVDDPAGAEDARAWQDQVRETVDAIAGVTAVDGATVITDRYELLAFGAKIARRDGSPQVEQIALTEPIEGSTLAIVHPNRIGNTRHMSAAQFVQDQHDALALVASVDGRFTVFAWSTCENLVHAHRVEALLL
jgi:hypothetical protein